MARKAKVQLPKALPENFLAIADSLNLRVVCYLHESVECSNGHTYWLPQDLIGHDGKTLIIYRRAHEGNYSVAGWEPWHDGMFGGRSTTIHGALHWVKTAYGVRAGTVQDFRGA